MSDLSNPSRLSAAEQITVLLAEYDARQAEKTAAAQGFSASLGVATAVLAGILALIIEAGHTQLWLVVPGALLALIALEFHRQFAVLYSSVYVKSLERRINRLAGEELLLWEQRWTTHHRFLRRLKTRKNIDMPANINLGLIVASAFGFAIIIFFFFALVRAANVIESGMGGIRMHVATALYITSHLGLAGAVGYNRFVRQRGELSNADRELNTYYSLK